MQSASEMGPWTRARARAHTHTHTHTHTKKKPMSGNVQPSIVNEYTHTYRYSVIFQNIHWSFFFSLSSCSLESFFLCVSWLYLSIFFDIGSVVTPLRTLKFETCFKLLIHGTPSIYLVTAEPIVSGQRKNDQVRLTIRFGCGQQKMMSGLSRCCGLNINRQCNTFMSEHVAAWLMGRDKSHLHLCIVFKGEVRTINDRNICERRSCMKNNGKSPTFKFVSGEERRPSEVQRVSWGWRLPGVTYSSADLTWIRKWLEIQAPELSELESVELELGSCCSDLDKQVSGEICRTWRRQFEIPFRL